MALISVQLEPVVTGTRRLINYLNRMVNTMARFHDLVNAIKEPGEEGVDASIYDDLTAEYDSTFENYTSSVRQRDDKIAELEGKVGTLKSQNFDLLMSSGTGDNAPEDQSTQEVVTEPTIDTLFIKKR